jgi:hypothetical protein
MMPNLEEAFDSVVTRELGILADKEGVKINALQYLLKATFLAGATAALNILEANGFDTNALRSDIIANIEKGEQNGTI